jgi:hypothetical protein
MAVAPAWCAASDSRWGVWRAAQRGRLILCSLSAGGGQEAQAQQTGRRKRDRDFVEPRCCPLAGAAEYTVVVGICILEGRGEGGVCCVVELDDWHSKRGQGWLGRFSLVWWGTSDMDAKSKSERRAAHFIFESLQQGSGLAPHPTPPKNGALAFHTPSASSHHFHQRSPSPSQGRTGLPRCKCARRSSE